MRIIMLFFPVSGMFETFNVIKRFKLVNEIFPGNSTVGQCWIYKVFVSGFCVCLLDLLIPSSGHCQTSRKSFSKSDSPALSRVLIPLIIVTQRWGLYQSLHRHLQPSTLPSRIPTASTVSELSVETPEWPTAIMLHFFIPECRQKAQHARCFY